jgi:hypothetical protein
MALGVALALLAGAVWNAFREDRYRWWMLRAGLIAAVLWILFDEWRDRRKPQQAR